MRAVFGRCMDVRIEPVGGNRYLFRCQLTGLLRDKFLCPTGTFTRWNGG
jgi:hypothetical protein